MAKIEVSDDCFAPYEFMWLKYSGKDPWGVSKKISDSIRSFFHLSTSSMRNEKIIWDISDDPITFYSVFWFQRPMTGHTYMYGKIYLQGGYKKDSKEGNLTIKFEARLDTEFKGWKPFLYPVWYMYSYLFYNKQRRQMIEQCSDLMDAYRNELKKHFGLKVAHVPQKSYE